MKNTNKIYKPSNLKNPIKNISENNSLTRRLTNNRDYLLDLLHALDGITQSPKYHPESDALFHSLQVFEWAYRESDDPELWLAALFHDVGKSVDSKSHCEIGAEMLSNIFTERAVWLIAHHLDLMKSPQMTRKRLANSNKLKELSLLRRWDMAGREPDVEVRQPEEALDLILEAFENNH